MVTDPTLAALGANAGVLFFLSGSVIYQGSFREVVYAEESPWAYRSPYRFIH
jgi:hypothetical protein